MAPKPADEPQSRDAWVLEAVRYELRPSEVEFVQGERSIHVIDRENCLIFRSGRSLYFSWTNKPEEYCIGLAEASLVSPSPESMLDMSKHEWWQDPMGCEPSYEYLGETRQVLPLGTPDRALFLSSQENGERFLDAVTISKNDPRPRKA